MRLIPSVILLALLGIVYWVGATLFTDRIQTDITERSSAALSAVNPDVGLSVDGRDVTITGLVNTEQQKHQAKETVDSVWGVRASQNRLAIRDPYNFHATNNGSEGMIMSGKVDSADALDYMKNAITPAVPNGNVDTQSRPLPNSGQKLALGAGALLLLKNGDLKIDEQRLLLTGDADDDQVKSLIEANLRNNQALLDPLQVVTDINVLDSMTQACRSMLDSLIDQDTVLFDVDSAYVNEKYSGTITAYAQLLQTCPGTVLVEAHADQDGSEDYNLNLSQARAEAVVMAMIQHGTSSDRVQSFSYGETRPIASNESVHDKAYNRRVDLEYIHSQMPNLTSIQQPIISSQSAE